MKEYKLLTILGHTAGGKTSLAAHTALMLDGEIISADSRQVYRGMDLGTGKDYGDYTVSGTDLPFHLIDIADAGYEYSVFEFQRDFTRVFHQITDRGKIAVMCGGSGLYIESILRKYRMINVPVNQDLREDLSQKSMDELINILKSYGSIHNTTDTASRKRAIRAIEIEKYQKEHEIIENELPEFNSLVVGLKYERDERRSRITKRLHERLDEGMVDEVRALMDSGIGASKLEYYGLEYKYLSQYVSGIISYDQMVSQLNTAIHRFAKRQMTYFRGMERRGIKIHWL
ncbi:tRNA (adenosine(37)-N6)-dimethylallyltransferase MiaA, partial [Bacteroidota bacterium]